MLLRERVYEKALQAARPVIGLAAPLNAQVRRAFAGREAAVRVLEEWARHRRADSPLVWVHAPSVGESLMAQAIIEDVKRLVPGVQIAFTHFSPSAERIRERIGADVSAYLPWDIRSDIEPVLDALRPSVVAFVRTEIWPVLVDTARQRQVRTCVVNGVLSAHSSRLRGPSRFMLSPSYARLDAVGAINTAAAERFERLGARHDIVSVTGDARFDQVWRRVQRIDPNAPLLQRIRDEGRYTIIAGSTWPSDDERLVPALADVLRDTPGRAIVAPHQPDAKHIAELEETLTKAQLRFVRLADVERGERMEDVVIVDRVGVLADLYAIADVAYVGGGFHSAGLHSIVEPAGLGVPVVFGPGHANAAEAAEMLAAGGALEAADAGSLVNALRALQDRETRARTGDAARMFVESRLGAASRNAALIRSLV